MRRPLLVAAGFVSLLSTPVAGQVASPLAERIQRITGRPEFRHALWGIDVYDLDAKRPIYTLNEEKLFTPGSTTKLLSAGTALALLGADHRFHTRVYRTGPIAKDGTLRGDLVLVASGDPNLSQRVQPNGTLAFENHDHSYGGASDTRAVPGNPLTVIEKIAGQIASRGIRRISGRVIVDASLFPEGDRELGTGVVISPVSINDNVIDITVAPGASPNAPAIVTTSPRTSFVQVVNRATTVEGGGTPGIDIDDAVNPRDSTVTLTVSGRFPTGTAGVLYAYAVPSPSRFATAVLTEALVAKGVVIPAPAPAGGSSPRLASPKRSYADTNAVAEHVSAPAAEMVKVILKVSQNLHASMMPYVLAALRGTEKEQTGFDLEREWLLKEGLDVSGAQQGDGAGGDAHFTPAFMVSYLEMMSRRPDFQAFHDALPILGKDGTLYNIQPLSAAAGKVHAKTGTFVVGDPLNRALLVTGKGLAGYMTTAGGRRLALAVYANNVRVSTAPDEVTRLVGQASGEVAAAVYDDH